LASGASALANVIADEDREKFLKWISTIDFEKIHREIYAKKHKGTGDWLLQDEEFEKWLTSSTSSLLWCHGTRKY